MKIIQLPLQKENAKLPSQLDFLSVINRRGSDYFSKEKALYKSLQAGHLGEERVLQYIKKYGKTHWKVFRNVWLNHLGNFECDLILLTSTSLQILEIKNFTGIFKYDDGRCFFENTETSINPVEQVRGNLADLKKILQSKIPHLNIKAAVIFTGNDNDVQVKTVPNAIEIINRTQIRNFVRQIAREEETSQAKPLNLNLVYKLLAQFETSNPFIPTSLTKSELQEMTTGIYCPRCQTKNIDIQKFKVKCSCGLTISRDEAVLRAICDYGVLNYERDFTRKEIQYFLGSDASLYILHKLLPKYFTRVNNGPRSYYKNKKLLYDDLFCLNLPQVLETQNSDLIIFNPA